MLLMEERMKVHRLPKYGMMSDQPGAGKTYAVLGFIYFSDKVIFAKQKRPHNVNLIVVPYNICTQWEQSIIRIFGPSGTIANYKVLTEYSDIMTLYTNPTFLFEYDILITTSLYFSFIAGTMNSLRLYPKRVFFDEADTVQNMIMVKLPCDMTWFISASMQTLFPKNSDKVTIGQYQLSLKILQEHNICCEDEFLNTSIVLERPLVYVQKCHNVYFALLCTLVDTNHHCRLHAMDYSFIRSDLVMETDTIDSEYKACLYLLRASTARLAKADATCNLLQRDLETIQNRICHTDQEKHDNEMREAQVKLEMGIQNKIIKECQRKLSVIRFFSSKYDVDDEFQKVVHPCEQKLDRIQTIISEIMTTRKTSAQCIVFSDFDHVYGLLATFLKAQNIPYRFLDGGNIQSMDDIISAYKAREFSVLLADSSMYSCGMNLENTSDIIFIHKMDEQKEKQVIGRAQRYGRNGVLNIWYVDYVCAS